jgi:hypothetical protein
MSTFAKWLLFLLLLSAVVGAHAQIVNAVGCAASELQNALNAVASGGTVIVPAGSCSWSGVSVNKPVTLQGAGTGLTNINLPSGQSFTITKQAGGVVRVKGFTFSCSNLQSPPHPIVVNGAWQGTQPVIFQNDAFKVDACTPVDIFVPGGVIFSHVNFSGTWDNAMVTVKNSSDKTSWNTADTLGGRDTNGLLNVYIEDSTFTGGANGITDCDDGCRMVVRHNTFSESGGFNSHGWDTSPQGLRHFEIYSNQFSFPDKTCTNGQHSLSNINQYIWIRGGSGVVYNNSFEDLSSTCWGNKTEVKLSIRGAEDARPQGSCSSVSYAVPHQLGQSNNGTSDFRDPIYFWGNSGTMAINGGWGWGNPCGLDWNTFWQWGRDGINTGSPRPSYSAYVYPHPLASGGGSSGTGSPTPPSGLTATVQ